MSCRAINKVSWLTCGCGLPYSSPIPGDIHQPPGYNFAGHRKPAGEKTQTLPFLTWWPRSVLETRRAIPHGASPTGQRRVAVTISRNTSHADSPHLMGAAEPVVGRYRGPYQAGAATMDNEPIMPDNPWNAPGRGRLPLSFRCWLLAWVSAYYANVGFGSSLVSTRRAPPRIRAAHTQKRAHGRGRCLVLPCDHLTFQLRPQRGAQFVSAGGIVERHSVALPDGLRR
jgi:hypothetical protein